MTQFWEIFLPVIIPLGVSLLCWLFIKSFGLGQLTNKISNIENKIGDLEDDFKYTKDSLLLIKGGLVQAGVLKESFLTKPNSPIQLTESGRRALEETGFIQIFQARKSELAQLIRAKSPQTKYDLQKVSEEVLHDGFLDDQAMKQFKIYVFKKGMPLGDLLDSAAVYVRDALAGELDIRE